jgi:hypothetical protein
MKRTRRQLVVPLMLLLMSSSAIAGETESSSALFPDKPSRSWQIDWSRPASPPATFHAIVSDATVAAADQTAPPRATEYSRAYQVRAKIHRYASFATLPLFATEIALGQSLYGNPGESKKTAHAIVGASIGSLFAVNTVTGAMNLWEARKDAVGRKRRLAHGLLMMAADAGFFATFLAAPESEEGEFTGSRSPHRTIAITSIGLATVGYLTMLFGGK